MAFLSGVMRGAGSIRPKAGKFEIVIESLNKKLILKLAALAKELYNTEGKITTFAAEGLNKREGYNLILSEQVSTQLLQESGLQEDAFLDSVIPQFVLAKEHNAIAYLQGLLASCGTLSTPHAIDSQSSQTNKGIKRQGYHLELRLASRSIALQVLELINKFNIKASIILRNHYSAVYIKGSETISDFLAMLGANKSVLALQEIIISRSIRNLTNRQYNCTIANINKSLSASEKQIRAIELIDKKKGLDWLAQTLKDTALIRLANPSANLSELLTLHSENLSKSGLNHRLRKIIKIAESIKEQI